MRPKHLTTLFFFILLVVFKKDSIAQMGSIIDLELNSSAITELKAPSGLNNNAKPKVTFDQILLNPREAVSSSVHTNIIGISD